MQMNRFFDPLYGRTSLNAWEADLMRAPEVQRLRNIRMCNINSLLMTGASEVSRFEHSLGVVRLAKEWAFAAKATDDEAIVLSAAAMLHDIKTGPFGHSLEYTLADNPRLSELQHQRIDQSPENDFFQRTRANISYLGAQFAARDKLGNLWPAVARTIAGEGPLGPLINSSIDLDNIDNVVRLAYHMGIATRDDTRLAISLAKDIRVELGGLSITSPSISFVKRWQSLRHRLYRYLLHDWAEFSAKGMLTKAIEVATDAGIIGTDSWILTDNGLLQTLINDSIGEHQEIGTIIKRLMLAQLYRPVSLLRGRGVDSYRILSNPGTKRALEEKMGALLKSQCVFHVILDRAKTDRKLLFYVRDQERKIEIGHDTKEILVGLFASRSHGEGINARAVTEFRRNMLPYIGNFVELDDPLEDPFDSSPDQLRLI